MARKRRRRKGFSGLGRSPASGSGSFCMMVRTGSGKNARASTRCFGSEAQMVSAMGKRGMLTAGKTSNRKSILLYRRKG